ncbi:universal stress protein [Labedaea rhizosphaerae]|uniref:Nucleotide-binding universal stress UspA family protein n=1 Tax=Labedaea rhizosphaerae TaxID=598644 RepID=A0A4R6SER1_LABRH|nr:universal stress protein [Labedaea rhizosphaerae]TDQ00412.1 nucleotide-binding universal stress UspA family protein [Labedaea rhizosphaerae]
MSTNPRPPVLVGVDGSDSALAATRWAARSAKLRGLPLRIVHACVLPPIQHPTTTASQARWVEALTENGQHIIAEAAHAARVVAPEVEIVSCHEVGTATEVLIEKSADAHCVVLGHRGLGGFRDMLVGSVAVALTAHGHGPVVVVRGVGDRPPRTEGPVVVGVDGTPASEAAIEYAFDEASMRGAELVAVHTWLDIAFARAWTALPWDSDWQDVVDDETVLLAERLAGWQDKYPDVRVTRVVAHDRPVRALTDAAEQAQLVVVGSRGRGAFTGMGLGSTSQALVHTAPCPIAVVRPPAEQRR